MTGTSTLHPSTLALMCDPRDIGQTLGDGASPGLELAPGRNRSAGQIGGFDPTIFLFDAHPGGVGLAPRIFERAGELLERASILVERCACTWGCPACIGPMSEHSPIKQIARDMLQALLPGAEAGARLAGSTVAAEPVKL